ncbi:AzlD domain-containing protein [Pollutimonas thiosulfatoxidans]|uniref:Uncharacterized protein n=1 Tax=Pollutimonas thiosulfatoxidans TaxID=2028345 RepID=A0A451FSN5_9BURK|nr:AzlD domain-containing protein [Pollutimonas thiosulfatoxidans]MBF6616263.1 AzlD domain-containing protein [Candidimonas sp.]NYT45921.1 AzlD domain-containing protein [Alcaligenaceae bacterium]QAA95501.1 hypothetical protein CKA81_06310 [Pollutimonas thiosulfatoxidans]
MSTTTLVWIIALSAAGTFLIRYLPMLWQDRAAHKARGHGTLRRALDAVGPAAIVALLVASFWSMVAPDPSPHSIVPLLVGLLGVAAGKRVLGSIAWATLAGVLAYGAAVWVLMAVSP